MSKTAVKEKPQIHRIQTAQNELKKGSVKNTYLLFGADQSLLNTFVTQITEKVKPDILSDFDNETYFGSTHSCADVFSSALSYPFGGGKKLIIYREFEKTDAKDRERLLSYLESPSPDTVLVIIYDGIKKDFDKGVLLKAAGYGIVYEAPELKGNELASWVTGYMAEKGKKISWMDAQLLIDITGSDTRLLENQLEKMITNAGEEELITADAVRLLSDNTKEYTIFDLQNALGGRNKELAFKIANSMVSKGDSILPSLTMLFRYFFGLARLHEMMRSGKTDDVMARSIGVHPFFLKDSKAAAAKYTMADLYRIIDALHRTELAVKTSATDEKTLFLMLMSEILA